MRFRKKFKKYIKLFGNYSLLLGILSNDDPSAMRKKYHFVGRRQVGAPYQATRRRKEKAERAIFLSRVRWELI